MCKKLKFRKIAKHREGKMSITPQIYKTHSELLLKKVKKLSFYFEVSLLVNN